MTSRTGVAGNPYQKVNGLKYRRIELVDSRQCLRCGAVAGRCDHLQEYNDVLEVPDRPIDREIKVAWLPEENQALRNLWLSGRSSGQIAEILNRSRSAVTAQVGRLGIRRKDAA
jgi:DNA-binding NarL/FixJ family response regulator